MIFQSNRTLYFFRLLYLCICLAGTTVTSWSQQVTKVDGTVIDAATGEPLPFVNVTYVNSYVGTTTDLDGKFTLESKFPTDSISVSYIGYNDLALPVVKETKQTLTFQMESSSLVLESVTVSAKKRKYSKKNNPSVELIKKVMANKNENRIENNDYYSFDQYEKVEFDLNNITEDFKNSKILKPFNFIFDYIDTSQINGKTYLPMFFRETYSSIYYRKDPNTKKEHKHGIKLTEFAEQLDLTSIDDLLDVLYQDVNIYNNNVRILGTQFVSPVSPLAVNFYRFYIQDTVDVSGVNCINLAFIPKNKQNFGFTGNLYISNDDKYSIRKVKLNILGDINLNFVRDMQIEQEFTEIDSVIVLTRDEITVDYSITENGIGFFGTRDVSYDNHSFDKEEDESVYEGLQNKVVSDGVFDKTEEFWDDVRINPLSTNQAELYEMVDSLKNLKAYKRVVGGLNILMTGFIPAGKFEIGPLPSFVSFNEVEGWRFKLGAESNYNLSEKLYLKGYVAYGLKDKTYKYSGSATYSLFKPFRENPRDFVSFGYSKETSFPGRELEFFSEDNFLLSFQRGSTDRMLLSKTMFAEYTNEGIVMDFGVRLESKNRIPYGNLTLPINVQDEVELLSGIKTAEVGLNFKFAPNEQFVQGRQFRTPIFNKYPVFNLNYSKGFSGVLGGEYNYHKVKLNIFKRFYLSLFGHTNFEFEGGKAWGRLPYLLYFLPRANQTYAYQKRSYNMMNFLEFVSDEYVSVQITHFFNGFIFNRIPLWKKLKLREVVAVKAIAGRLSDANNPSLNRDLPGFTTDMDGNPTTFTLNDEPYVEASFGVMNIFKFFEIDLVKRMTHLDKPEVPELWGVNGLGIRARFKVEF